MILVRVQGTSLGFVSVERIFGHVTHMIFQFLTSDKRVYVMIPILGSLSLFHLNPKILSSIVQTPLLWENFSFFPFVFPILLSLFKE